MEEDKSVCLVTLSDGEHGQCGHSIQTKHQSFRKKRVTRKKKGGRAKRKSSSPAAPMKWISSAGVEATSGKCNWLTDSNVEREILLRKTKSIYS